MGGQCRRRHQRHPGVSAPVMRLDPQRLASIECSRRPPSRGSVLPRANLQRPEEGERMRETRVIQARRLTTILPAMTLAEALETTRIHRVASPAPAPPSSPPGPSTPASEVVSCFSLDTGAQAHHPRVHRTALLTAVLQGAPMRCPHCQHENREGARFCAACGRSLASRCPACGH
jgi:hypothetical protein